MTTGNGQLLTLGVIAEQVNIPLHRVEYFIRSRGIKETARAGKLRVFGPDVVDRLRAELAGSPMAMSHSSPALS